MKITNICKNIQLINIRSVNNLTREEVCSLLVSMAALNCPNSTLLEDVFAFIRKNMDKFNINLLVQIMTVGKYFFKYDKNEGIY